MRSLSMMAGLAALALLVQGCAAPKTLVATGGSRTDGTVKLAYDLRAFERPEIDMQQGIAAATERCRVWGYSGAEPFGGETRMCNKFERGSCIGWGVTVEFQCTGTPVASK